MTGMELNAQIWRDIASIADDEALMKRLAKYLKRLTAAKPDPTEMTYDEFTAMVNRSREQYNQGKFKSFASVEELDRFIQSQ